MRVHVHVCLCAHICVSACVWVDDKRASAFTRPEPPEGRAVLLLSSGQCSLGLTCGLACETPDSPRSVSPLSSSSVWFLSVSPAAHLLWHGRYLWPWTAVPRALPAVASRVPASSTTPGTRAQSQRVCVGLNGDVFTELLCRLHRQLQMTFQESNSISVLAASRNRSFDCICWKSLPQPASFS